MSERDRRLDPGIIVSPYEKSSKKQQRDGQVVSSLYDLPDTFNKTKGSRLDPPIIEII